MINSNKYQHFALDENNNIIDIKNTTSNKKYFCPYCHSDMIRKCGNIRQWHFAHKTEKCSYDNYLHSIAEIMIEDWFNKSESIILLMDWYETCNEYESCKWYDENVCKTKIKKQFDLKKYYPTCKREKKYEKYIADIYCENKTNRNKPIFIEIFVKHECSEEKKTSDIRIIEIKIKSEEDIINIINSSKIEESSTIKLYNFKREDKKATTVIRRCQKYILYPSLKSHVSEFSCKNYKQRQGIYEICIPYDIDLPIFFNYGDFYMVGKSKAYIDGYLKKDCQLCKWQGEDGMMEYFCKLYKKCGNPKYCKDNDALQCSMFRENTSDIKNAISELNQYINSEYIDIWKANSKNK